MKLLSFIVNGQTHIGGVNGAGGVVDLTALGIPDNMNGVIAGWDALKPRIIEALADRSLPALDFASLDYGCVTAPRKIVCVGLNYKSHAEETGGTAPSEIVFFAKFNDALTPCGKGVTLPPWLHSYDYEGELVIVIGRETWNIPREKALDSVFGYTCGNDLSARDSQFLSSQWLSGKALPGFGPAGPVIVTSDSFNPDAENRIMTEVNGVRVQSAVTSDMIFKCADIVSKASCFFRLSPGDLIFTGTPEGVIMGKEKGSRVWLKPGDTVKVTIDNIGTLTTPLV